MRWKIDYETRQKASHSPLPPPLFSFRLSKAINVNTPGARWRCCSSVLRSWSFFSPICFLLLWLERIRAKVFCVSVRFTERTIYRFVLRAHLARAFALISRILFSFSLSGGNATLPNVINNFVHVLMYFYYMLSAMGYRDIWWKKYMTEVQIVSQSQGWGTHGEKGGTFKTEQIYCLTGKATLGQNHPFLGVLFFLFCLFERN